MNRVPHYYGDTIRVLFFLAGLIMMGTLPFFKYIIDIPIFASIIFILVLDIAAGLTNPQHKYVIILDTIISSIAFAIFEYNSIIVYSEFYDGLFWTNQILAFIFFLAFYYSIKTWRGATWFLN